MTPSCRRGRGGIIANLSFQHADYSRMDYASVGQSAGCGVEHRADGKKGRTHRRRGGVSVVGYAALRRLADEEGELGEVLQGDAGAAGHGAQGVFGYVDLQLGLG